MNISKIERFCEKKSFIQMHLKYHLQSGGPSVWGAHFTKDFSALFKLNGNFILHWCSEVITMKFCTSHNSGANVACAKFCRDMASYNGVTLKTFNLIWIGMEKLFVKWASLHPPFYSSYKLYMRYIAWWPILELLSRYPLILVKSLQVIWRSGTLSFNLPVPDLHMSGSNFTHDRVSG